MSGIGSFDFGNTGSVGATQSYNQNRNESINQPISP